LSSAKLVSRSFPSKEQKMLKSIKIFLKNTKAKKNVLATVCAGLYCCLQAKKKKKNAS